MDTSRRRRFLLYDVFLHELGHLQLVDPRAKRNRRRFAHESKAQEFADSWREELWSEHFDHPDLVHNAPDSEELEIVQRVLRASSTGKKKSTFQDILDLYFGILCTGGHSDPDELFECLEEEGFHLAASPPAPSSTSRPLT